MDKIIFLNTGWMKDYKGLRNDKITGGGKHIARTGWGGEIFNFLPYKGKYYGYVEAGGAINIERIGADSDNDYLDNVTVVWTARSPEIGGTYIVGWYKNARLYKELQNPPSQANRRYRGKLMGFTALADQKDCELLPIDQRLVRVPRGKRGMGQRNVWYADDNPEYIRIVKDYIYKGIVPKPRRNKGRSEGAARQTDPFRRKQIEDAAIRLVCRHYGREGYIVDSVQKDNIGWDLTARHNEIELKLEVKGLSGSITNIELTPNEYAKMDYHQDTYRICIVTEALRKPKLNIFSYSPDVDGWVDEQGEKLIFVEIIGARASLRQKNG